MIHDTALFMISMLPVFMGFFSPGAMPYHRLNFELEMLNMEHKQVMSDLQKLPMEISDALDKCKALSEKTKSFSYYHGQVLREWIQQKKNVHLSKLKNRLLRKEQIELQESCEEVKRLFKEIHERLFKEIFKEIFVPCAERHQVG
ncbi:Disks large-like 5 [Cricetulus griseus]|uniref:Disks large-like 5 n=1 Tax=Cricetulus griseus TaxID=10029 RepID=G3IMN9_CRIGR|nr:Disks large-like 5 [Cricetulus griseus]